MDTSAFVEKLALVRMPNVFNPYRERCLAADRLDAPAIRQRNLTAYLEAAGTIASSVWFGRDLGYRGGRRTGLPLTDEMHLTILTGVFGGVQVSRATVGPPMAERTAGLVWNVIRRMETPPFLWNIFPFHPFEPGEPMSNRCHRATERRECEQFIPQLLDWLQPRIVVAIGQDAHRTLSNLGYKCTYVRHPSYGGHIDFVRGIERIFKRCFRSSSQANALKF